MELKIEKNTFGARLSSMLKVDFDLVNPIV